MSDRRTSRATGDPRTRVDVPWYRDLAVPVIAYSATAVVLTLLQYAVQKGGRSLDDVWIRYDAGAYITIARHGYSWKPSDPYPLVAWFPGYPLVIRAVTVVARDAVLAAVTITFASGLTAACLFWRWMAKQAMHHRERIIGLAVLLLFAWGWFLYGIAYSDALFLALAVGAFLLAERRQLLLATVLATVATAERPTGGAVTLGLVLLAMERDGALQWSGWRRGGGRVRLPLAVTREHLSMRQLIPLLSLVGIAAYSAYLAVRYGRPLLWLDAQAKWHQGPSAGPRSWFKLHMAAIVIKEHDAAYIAKAFTQLAALLGVAATIPSVIRRFGLGYAAYVGVIVAVVGIGTNDFVGPGRYLLGAFPVAALVGEWLSTRRVATAVWLVVSGTALVAQTVLFARGAYLT